MRNHLILPRAHGKLSLVVLFAVACVIGAVTMYYHEMWRDESQAFLLVRDSKTLGILWGNVRYEGHPFLWYFLLFITYHIFPSIYCIQVLHFLIGVFVMAVVVFYSPFSFVEKLLLTFSYFLSYEYLVISRNYSVGVLLLFLAVLHFYKSTSEKSIIITAVILGLCVNSNIYSLIVGCLLFVFFLCKHAVRCKNKKSKIWIAVAGVIFCLWLAVSMLQLAAPADRRPKLSIVTRFNVAKAGKVVKEVSEAFCSVPNPAKQVGYWNSSIFEGDWCESALVNHLIFCLPQLLSILLIVVLVYTIRKDALLLLFFIASFVSLLVFAYCIFDKGLLRHTGIFFILLVVTIWLYRSSYKHSLKSDSFLTSLFKTVLAIQVFGSAIAHFDEIKYPFSAAEDAARFLVRTGRNNDNIILHPDFEGMALLHYASIPSVYYATIKSRGSFIRFTDKRKPVSYQEVYTTALQQHITTMVFNGRKDDSLLLKMGYMLVYKPAVAGAIPDEDFYIYAKTGQK